MIQNQGSVIDRDISRVLSHVTPHTIGGLRNQLFATNLGLLESNSRPHSDFVKNTEYGRLMSMTPLWFPRDLSPNSYRKQGISHFALHHHRRLFHVEEEVQEIYLSVRLGLQ